MSRGSTSVIRGVGLGLRPPHYETIRSKRPPIPWFEVLVDNYFCDDAPPLKQLDAIGRDYPLTFHSVGLSLGSADPLNTSYLKRLKDLSRRYQAQWLSDHLCWTSLGGHYFHDLLPLPYTEEVVAHVARRIQQIQDFLGQRILIENVSSYAEFKLSQLTEVEFVSAVLKQADCDLLLDVNNIYVSATNHGFDPLVYLDAMPAARIKEIHLAGYADHGDYLLDTHGAPVSAAVWSLYEEALKRFGPVPTLIEWDTDIPDFDVLCREARQAECLMGNVEAA